MFRYVYGALIVCCFMPAVFAAESGLEGQFSVAGKELALSHVVVVDFDDAEGMGDGPELRVLFSTSEIAKTELEAPVLFNLDARARAGKLQGVLLRFDPSAETREVYGTTYVTPDDPQSSMPFFTLGGTSGGVDSLKVEDGKLSGHIINAADGDTDFGIPAYGFDITFNAPIQKASPVTVLTGKEAMDSIQLKVFRQFEEALRKGDLAAVRKMTSASKADQMDAFIAQVGKEKFLEMVQQMVIGPAALEQNLSGLYIRGDRATLVVKDGSGKTSMTLTKQGETWIVD